MCSNPERGREWGWEREEAREREGETERCWWWDVDLWWILQTLENVQINFITQATLLGYKTID